MCEIKYYFPLNSFAIAIDNSFKFINNENTMKITVYTITECQFSKQEKEYLASHSLAFEEKNVESNREFLSEMLSVGNNFAGTPLTKIEKDDGKIEILKGFTKEEFDKVLGFEVKTEAKTPAAEPVASSPAPTPVAAPIVPEPAASSQPVQTPPLATTPEDPLASVLNDLQSKATTSPEPVAPQAPVVAPTPPPTVVSGQPTIPDPQF